MNKKPPVKQIYEIRTLDEDDLSSVERFDSLRKARAAYIQALREDNAVGVGTCQYVLVKVLEEDTLYA